MRIMEETAKRERDTSDATKDKIAKARADLYASEQAYYSKTKELNSQIIAMNNEEAAAAKAKAAAIAKATEEKKKKEEDVVLWCN